MTAKKNRAMLDEIEKMEALGRQVLASFTAAGKVAGELQAQASRMKALALSTTKTNPAGPPTAKPVNGAVATSTDIDSFISWVEATFHTRNVGGLRELAAAFVDRHLDPFNRFVAADQNVTIFSVPLDSASVESLFADVDAAPSSSPQAPAVVRGNELTKPSPPPSPVASTKAAKRRNSKSDDSIVQATPTPPSKKPKLALEVAPPKPTASTPQKKTPTKVALTRKRKPKTAALTAQGEDAAPEGRRRASERNAAILGKIVRREQDTKLRALNDEPDRTVAPVAPIEVTVDDEGDVTTNEMNDTPAAETEPPVADDRRRPSERGAAAVGVFLRRERDMKLRVLNDESDAPTPKASKSKHVDNGTKDTGTPKTPPPTKHVIHVGAAIMSDGSGAVKAAFEAAIKAKPWLKWSQNFRSFLPTDQRARMAWTASLSNFFEQHAFTMWSQFFVLDHVRPKSQQEQFTRALHACFKLVHRLHVLEGVGVFKFLLRAPHPAWPTFLESPISLATMPHADAIAYLKAESTSRFPRSPTPSAYDPMQIVKEMVKAEPQVLEDANIPLDLAPTLLAQLDADASYDFDECPYIGVTMYGEDPPLHLEEGEFPTPASQYVWDWDRKQVVSRVGLM